MKNNENYTNVEKRIINLVRNLRPYDSIEISLQKQDFKILQIICRNIVKELFPVLKNEKK